jgi:hypothetical protein
VGKWVSYLNRERKLDSLVGRRPTAPPAPRGLYIYGNVGSGNLLNFINVYLESKYFLAKNGFCFSFDCIIQGIILSLFREQWIEVEAFTIIF